MRENLEGAKCAYKLGSRYISCIVTGDDPDVGFTLQENDGIKRYVVCLNGPSSPVFKKLAKSESFNSVLEIEKYKALREALIKMVKEGVVIPEELDKAKAAFDSILSPSGDPTSDDCAFSQ